MPLTPPCEVCGDPLSFGRATRSVFRPNSREYTSLLVSGKSQQRPVRWICGHCEDVGKTTRSAIVPVVTPAIRIKTSEPSASDLPLERKLEEAVASQKSLASFPSAVDRSVTDLLKAYDPECGMSAEEYLRRYLPGAILLASIQEAAAQSAPKARPGLPVQPTRHPSRRRNRV